MEVNREITVLLVKKTVKYLESTTKSSHLKDNEKPEDVFSPSHHQTNSFDMRQIQRLRIRLRPPSIGRLERTPRQVDLLHIVLRSLLRHLENSLPADARLLPPIIPPRRYLVLERQGISLLVGLGHRDDDAVVGGQVPVQHAQAMLRREAGTAQRLGVEMAVEAGPLGVHHEEVGLAGASANSIV